MADLSYFREGTTIIAKRLHDVKMQAESPEWFSYCPIGMTPERGRGYLAGKIDALTDALEMMGDPEILNSTAKPVGIPPAHSPAYDTSENAKYRFAHEWNEIIGLVSLFASKRNMPKPEMIFHPKWLEYMNSLSDIRLAPVLIYMDVKIRFGYFEQRDVLKSI